MEAPPHSVAPPISTTTTATPAVYAGSVGSSPRTRHTGSYNADPPPPPPPPKLRLMCSYGGHVVPRPHDKTLCYVGGDTRIIAVDRHTSLSEFNRRLSKILLDNQPFSLKYQLPDEDLDSLISVTADEDFENMVDEYDRLSDGGGGGRMKHGRLRLFLFPKSSSSVKSEGWFFNALNWKAGSGSDRGFSESSSVNCLLGLDDDFFVKAAAAAAVVEKDAEPLTEGSKTVGTGNGVFNGSYVGNQDVHSVRGSPLPETSSSSSGSASGSPSDPKTGGSGIEEQFQQMSVGIAGNANSPLQPKQEDARVFTAGAGGAAGSGTVVSGVTAVVGGEYAAANRGSSDDERSDHGGYIQVQQIQPQVQPHQLQTQQTPQFQQNQISASDLPSPDSVSSEEITKNPQSKQIQATNQEPPPLIQSTNAPITPNHVLDPNITDQTNLHIHPQFQESSYVISAQYDQTHIAPQQFIHTNNQYIPAVPIASYYPIYPSQEQHQPMLDNQYPMYYISNRQAPQSRNAPEIGVGLYRTTTTAAGVQYVGYSQIHHPSSAPVNPGYGYEYAEPTTNHGQMYYTPLPHQLAAAKYQTAVAAGPTVAVLPDASAPQARSNEQF
ncbi:hypothetical protein ABFS83_05G038300 [Erythranthe nasuta]